MCRRQSTAPGSPGRGQRLKTSAYFSTFSADLRCVTLFFRAASWTVEWCCVPRRREGFAWAAVLSADVPSIADGTGLGAAAGCGDGSSCRRAAGPGAGASCALASDRGSVVATAIKSRSTPTRCARTTAPAASPASNAPHDIQNAGPCHSSSRACDGRSGRADGSAPASGDGGGGPSLLACFSVIRQT